jgi:hypothetical protein
MKGIIYKLVCNSTGKVYYGATCRPYLSQRISAMKCAYRRYKEGKPKSDYITAYEVLENKNFSYVVCETIECEDIDDIMLRVRWYIENNECVNIVIPLRTNEEYRQTEKYKSKSKTYREKHKEYQRVYRETHREQKKAYMKIYNKTYYNKHREKFLKRERNKKFHYVEPEEPKPEAPPSSPRPPPVENTTFIKIKKKKGSVILEF